MNPSTPTWLPRWLARAAASSTPLFFAFLLTVPGRVLAQPATVDICNRTESVQSAILMHVQVTATACAEVSRSELAAITTLRLDFQGVPSFQASDFAGLASLTTLDLGDNLLTGLPAGVFDALTSLTALDLSDNFLEALPAGIFDKLTKLTHLELYLNRLESLPAGVFDALTSLTALDLSRNSLLSYSPYLLSPLTSLARLDGASYTRPLPSGVPANLTATVRADGIEFRWTAPATGDRPTSYRILRRAGADLPEVYVEDTYNTSGDTTIRVLEYQSVRVSEYQYQV